MFSKKKDEFVYLVVSYYKTNELMEWKLDRLNSFKAYDKREDAQAKCDYFNERDVDFKDIAKYEVIPIQRG